MLIRNRIWLSICATAFVLLTLLAWLLPLLIGGDDEDDDDFRTTNEPFPSVVVDP
jgi:hypothetical protein